MWTGRILSPGLGAAVRRRPGPEHRETESQYVLYYIIHIYIYIYVCIYVCWQSWYEPWPHRPPRSSAAALPRSERLKSGLQPGAEGDVRSNLCFEERG